MGNGRNWPLSPSPLGGQWGREKVKRAAPSPGQKRGNQLRWSFGEDKTRNDELNSRWIDDALA